MPDGESQAADRPLRLDEVKTRADLDRLDQREYARLAGTPASRLDLLEQRCEIADAFASLAEQLDRASRIPTGEADEAG